MERKPENIFDELLVLRCQDNDQEAQGLLWKRWQPRIMKWSFDFLKDQEVAYEVAQESWMSIFKSIGRLKDPGLFRFWAYRIVQRRSADWIRKEQRKRATVEEVRHDIKEVDDEVEPDKVGVMLAAINDLPEDHQQILRMFYLEKTPIKLIAKIIDKPEGTVKSRLYHAREQLKIKLKDVNNE